MSHDLAKSNKSGVRHVDWLPVEELPSVIVCVMADVENRLAVEND
ncbi:MAG: hypothetical protein AAF589_04060 [Planctomycetota bacterium]